MAVKIHVIGQFFGLEHPVVIVSMSYFFFHNDANSVVNEGISLSYWAPCMVGLFPLKRAFSPRRAARER